MAKLLNHLLVYLHVESNSCLFRLFFLLRRRSLSFNGPLNLSEDGTETRHDLIPISVESLSVFCDTSIASDVARMLVEYRKVCNDLIDYLRKERLVLIYEIATHFIKKEAQLTIFRRHFY